MGRERAVVLVPGTSQALVALETSETINVTAPRTSASILGVSRQSLCPQGPTLPSALCWETGAAVSSVARHHPGCTWALETAPLVHS